MTEQEIFGQIKPSESKFKAQLISEITREQLEHEFEETWAKYRESRSVVTNQDGTKTEHLIYRIAGRSVVEVDIVIFANDAMILGYQSTLSSIAIPNLNRKKADWNEPSIFFFISRTLSAGQKTTPEGAATTGVVKKI